MRLDYICKFIIDGCKIALLWKWWFGLLQDPTVLLRTRNSGSDFRNLAENLRWLEISMFISFIDLGDHFDSLVVESGSLRSAR